MHFERPRVQRRLSATFLGSLPVLSLSPFFGRSDSHRLAAFAGRYFASCPRTARWSCQSCGRTLLKERSRAGVSSPGRRPSTSSRTMPGARYVSRMCDDRWSRLTPSRCASASMVASRPDINASRVAYAFLSRAIICPSGLSARPPPAISRIPLPARRSLASARSSVVSSCSPDSSRDALPIVTLAISFLLGLTTTSSTRTHTRSTINRMSSRILIDGKAAQPCVHRPS